MTNKPTVFSATILLIFAVGAIFLNPFIVLQAYEIAALKYSWYTPTYWEMFGLYTLLHMLFAQQYSILTEIYKKVRGETTVSEALSFVLSVPIVLTFSYFIVYLTL